MNEKIRELFQDEKLIKKIQDKLPKLFHQAELESSRAGKIGMEVGSVREKILVALLLYKFGKENVVTDIPITEAEIDVIVHKTPISIKTITGRGFGGVKLIWTVDAVKALYFLNNYKPSCDLIFVQINWANEGAFYYIPLEVQQEIFRNLGKEKYIKLPIAGTNPRGVEMKVEAMLSLATHEKTFKIPIDWSKENLIFKPYSRWVELWQED
ncbi:MAG: ThaI family type II restriction endonuclease [Candidatus Jettenia sp.]|nr:ThaI family type II restriction endonuclease [Candidatus Jettenia sp.]